jgi:hypothetical protein
MKIKLQEYSLISNEWIESEIKILSNKRDSYPVDSGSWTICDVRITILKHIKQQLIPSEKLADKVYEDCTVIGTALSFKEQTQHKQIYLNSEIEIQ